MRVTLFHDGHAIGTGNVGSDTAFFSVDLRALPAYETIRRTVDDSWRAVRNLGFLPPDDAFVGGVTAEGDQAGKEVLGRLEDIEQALELRDDAGEVLRTESITLVPGVDAFGIMGRFAEHDDA